MVGVGRFSILDELYLFPMWKLVQRKQNKRTAESQVEEAGIGLSLTAFIGTANLFFTGLVILNLNDLPKIVQLPVVYLVVSAVAFILSSVIYANISGMHRQSALRSSMMLQCFVLVWNREALPH